MQTWFNAQLDQKIVDGIYYSRALFSSKTKIVALLLIGVFNLDRYTLNNIQTINALVSNAYNSEDLKYSSNALYLVCVHLGDFKLIILNPSLFKAASILKI